MDWRLSNLGSLLSFLSAKITTTKMRDKLSNTINFERN